MKRIVARPLAVVALALAGVSVFAGVASWGASAIDGFDFADAELAERYRRLLVEFRCPKCLNESLASSGAPIAVDLRRVVRRHLEEGASDDAIRQYLQQRYGDFVLYDPPLRPATLLLWLAPLVLAIFVALVLRRIARRDEPATPVERRRAEALLRQRE